MSLPLRMTAKRFRASIIVWGMLADIGLAGFARGSVGLLPKGQCCR